MSEELKKDVNIKKINVDIQEVRKMVKEKGMTRDEIAAHYGISKKACREQIFSHPDLKGIRKPQAPRGVVINLTGGSNEDTNKQESNLATKDLAEEAPSKEPVSESDAGVQAETEEEDSEEVAETTGTAHYSADEDDSEDEEEGVALEEDESEEDTDEDAKPASGVEW